MKTILAIVIAILLLLAAGWAVSKRMKDLGVTAPVPVLADRMPEFVGIEAWLNSGPLTAADLKGKVVLVDFWTYSCINCIRTLPYVTSWHEKYKDKGFTVIGVHTPEFAFEKEEDNVREAIARHGITYPVALDNGYATWNAYANRYWPAHYLFDAQGRLRFTHFGEGKYEETERNIQALIEEAGRDAKVPRIEYGAGSGTATVPGTSPEFEKIGSPETYLGYERLERFGSPEEVRRDQAQAYSAPEPQVLNRLYLSGAWRVEAERAVAAEAGAAILYRYDAASVNLVMAPPEGASGRVLVIIDGQEKGEITVDGERLYELHATPGAYGEHLLELRFLTPGTAAYAFTFG